MVEIVNRQRKIKIDPKDWRELSESAILLVPAANGRSVTIAFVADDKMRLLNREFRGQAITTDVLSFPYQADEFDDAQSADNLGDIVISGEQAERQAAENGLTLKLEISQLILHGILHLCGYDHEIDDGEMNNLELELRARLGVS